VYGIVKQMAGWIWVYSEIGHGTTFKLYFPRTNESAIHASAILKTDLRGEETILVIEDQDEVRGLAVAALSRYGYKVHGAAEAREAVAFCRNYRGPLHLVVTDVVMPGLSGRELANEIALIRPGLPVLFMSGYTDNAIGHHGVLDEGVEYIQKPFTPTVWRPKYAPFWGHASSFPSTPIAPKHTMFHWRQAIAVPSALTSLHRTKFYIKKVTS
jgi:two-component system cell cycle sensor histidine kinase/response regulator CckA